MNSVPVKILSNGLRMPIVGLGTSAYGTQEEIDRCVYDAVKEAIKIGYRHIDCATYYKNEKAVGKALKDAIENSDGALKREDFFVTSKCWNTEHSKARVRKALQRSLEDLNLSYLDLYLIHWPMGFQEGGEDVPMSDDGKVIPSDVSYLETYAAMEEMVEEGKIRSIGLSNFNIQQVKEILAACKIRPVCNQIEVNPNLHNNEWIDFCQKENIVVVAYAPFGSPECPFVKSDRQFPIDSEVIARLGKKYNKSPAQVILRWLIQRGLVVIPKSSKHQRLIDNMNIFDFELESQDIEEFKSFEEVRSFVFQISDNNQYFPF